MLVKKKSAEWFPSENKNLKVGDIIDITDPKQLILNGDVIALDENGIEQSAYSLYGVIVGNELEEFKRFQAIKQAEAEKSVLEKQKVELEAELAKTKPSESTPVETVKDDLETLSYQEIQKKAADAGVSPVVGVAKADLIKAIKEKK